VIVKHCSFAIKDLVAAGGALIGRLSNEDGLAIARLLSDFDGGGGGGEGDADDSKGGSEVDNGLHGLDSREMFKYGCPKDRMTD